MVTRIVVLLLILLTACRSQGPPTSAAAGTEVEVMAGPAFLSAFAKTPDAYLLDVRTPAEQAGGMLADAIPLDYNDGVFAEEVAALERDRAVFVYCASGGRSGQAAALLSELGFARVVDLEGGYRGLNR